LHSSRCF